MAKKGRIVSVLGLVVVFLVILGFGVYFYTIVSDYEVRKNKMDELSEETGIPQMEVERREIVMREDPVRAELPIIETPLIDGRDEVYRNLQIGLVEVVNVEETSFRSKAGETVTGIMLDVKFEFNGKEKILKVPIAGTIMYAFKGDAYSEIDLSGDVVSTGDRVSIFLDYVNGKTEPDQGTVREVCEIVSNEMCVYYVDNFDYGNEPIDFYDYFYDLMESDTAELSFDYVIPVKMDSLGQ